MATNRKQSPQRGAARASAPGSGGPRRLGQQGGGRPASAGAQRRYERQRSRRGGSKWIGWLAVAAAFFLVPLGATLEFSLRIAGGHGFQAYRDLFANPDFGSTLKLSLQLAAETVAAVLRRAQAEDEDDANALDAGDARALGRG